MVALLFPVRYRGVLEMYVRAADGDTDTNADDVDPPRRHANPNRDENPDGTPSFT
jgi:hypothetical protein